VITARRKAVEHAIKSLELEGFSFSTEEKKILEKVASGKMSTEELRSYALNKRMLKEAIA
jgi:hypothetical protein